jgi:hypothetical protein
VKKNISSKFKPKGDWILKRKKKFNNKNSNDVKSVLRGGA